MHKIGFVLCASFCVFCAFLWLVSAATHDAQEEEEEVDEVEIERQRADDRVCSHATIRQRNCHLFQTLCIPRSQTGKHQRNSFLTPCWAFPTIQSRSLYPIIIDTILDMKESSVSGP